MRPIVISDLNLNKIDAVIFDLDGTVYNKKSLTRHIITGELDRLNFLSREQAVRKEIKGISFGSAEEFYKNFFGKMAEGQWWITPERARRWYMHHYMPTMVRVLRALYKVEPWVKELLLALRRAGKQVVVYSDYGMVREKLQALGIDEAYFDLAFDAPTLGGLKPCKESMEKVIAATGVPADRCLMIGDRDDTDGESARRVGANYLILEKDDEFTL